MIRWLWLLLCLFLCIPVLVAQEETPIPQTSLVLGSVTSGEINDSTPRQLFVFDGLRGEVIHFSLRTASGNLDPVLVIFNSEGDLILSRDDTLASQDVEQTLTLAETDRYLIVVGRFGYSLGSTSGVFELELSRAGVISEQGSALRYGDSVIDTITNTQPQVYYTFRATAGEIINIDMLRNSGTLDPYLQVLDSQRFIIADNDDIPGAESKNARIENLLIEEDGVYIIVASRYGEVAGDSAGSFVLTISESTNSGLGNSTLAPFPMQMNQVVEGEISASNYERFYTFNALKDDLITIKMDRNGRGRLDSYLILANAGLISLIEDDDSGTGQNARIESYRIPADGLYYIIATRFEGEVGTSVGGFRLQLESEGNAFDDVATDAQTITYGTTVTGNLGDANPDDLYAFWGEVGDAISISMTRGDGNLDSVIEILNADQNRLTRDDDGGESQNSRIDRYEIPLTGLYYIRATRYQGTNGDPNTAGTYILVLAQRVD